MKLLQFGLHFVSEDPPCFSGGQEFVHVQERHVEKANEEMVEVIAL